MGEHIDFWNLIARQRGMPEGWRWTSLETAGDFNGPRSGLVSLVTGAVCTVTFKSGPRKGQLNWARRDKSTERQLAITFSELHAFMEAWEVENKSCHRCYGTGQELASVSVAEGTKTRTCSRCKGTGAFNGEAEGGA